MASYVSGQLGGVETSVSDSSTAYRIKYFVVEEELDSYVPEIGDEASWAPVSSYVTSFEKAWQAPDCWIVSITATPADDDAVFSKQNLGSFVEKSYSVGEVQLPVEWFGARLASSQDCPEFSSDGKLSAGERRYLNVEGEWCAPGDPIFNNAVPYEIASDGTEKVAKASASKGTASYAKSPFQTSGASIDVSLIGQSVKTKIYECLFYTKRLPNNISDFVGVSGSFISSCRPSDASAGRWKALDQSVANKKSSDGYAWTSVSRRMILAPLSLKWDPDKNGGTWDW